MNKYSKFLFFLSFLSNSLYGEEGDLFQKEADFYRTSIQEKHLEANLIDSPQYKKCREEHPAPNPGEDISDFSQRVQNCFQEKFQDADIKELAKKTNLASINAEQTKTAKGIREYLSEKIERAIQGKDYDQKNALLKKKYVDQIQFFELYAEQLGKNIILETSNYCLENVRFTAPQDPTNSVENSFFLDFNIGTEDNPHTPCFYPFYQKDGDKLKAQTATIAGCLKYVKEIDFPQNGSPANFSTAEDLQRITKEELEKKSNIQGYFERRAGFCGEIIAPMCDRYKCIQSQISSPQSTPQDCFYTGELDDDSRLKSENISSTIATPQLINQGSKACNVLTKLRAYKKTLAEVEKIKEDIIKNGTSPSGYDISIAFDGAFNPEGDNSYSAITTVTSKEISENKQIKDLYGLEKKAEELEQKCSGLSANEIAENKECAELIDLDLKEKQVALETSFQAETAIRKEELDKLRSMEDIKKYLSKIGYDNLYDETLDPEKLKEIIREHYSSERTALIENMRKRLQDQIVKKEANDTGHEVVDVVNNKIEDLKNQKDHLGTVLHYNNVISSFLATQDKSTKEVSTNIVTLQREMEDYNNSKFKNEDDKEDQQLATKYFSNAMEGRSQGGKKASSLNYMDYLDLLIGNSK